MLLCVLDNDVLVAAFRSDAGASREVLRKALARRFQMLLSVPLMLEYEAVLNRPEQLAVSGATASDVDVVLNEIAAVGKHVQLAFRWRPALRDPNDDMVLETAINGQGHVIVTFNERDFNPVAAEFGCRVMRPGPFLRMLSGESN